MKKFLFVLGKNQVLSLCEISHILQYPPFKGTIIDFSKQVAIIQFEQLLTSDQLENLQLRLGGIQKICEIIVEYPKQAIIDGFPLEKDPKKFKKARRFIEKEVLIKILPQIFLNIENKKLMFAISVYPYLFSKPELSISHLIQFFNEEIKNKLNSSNNKATYFKYPKEFLESKDLNPIWPHHVIIYKLLQFPNAEILFGFTEEKCYTAKTIAVDNPNIKKMIDEKRPKTQFEISIPPKLAKILINLIDLPDNGNLLDPFCGTGTVLMMAAIQGYNFFGTDFNQQRIESARNNLIWLSKKFNLPIDKLERKIFPLDATQLDTYFKNNSIDGIATEPFLGPPLKHPLSRSEFRTIISKDIQPLYQKSLSSMKQILTKNGKIAIISPVYLTLDNTTVDFNYTKIAKDIGLKVVKLFPKSIFSVINDVTLDKKFHLIKKSQIIMRKINVFQKID